MQLQALPNPTTGKVKLSFDKSLTGKSIQLYNMQGQLIEERLTTHNSQYLDLSNYGDGVYILRIGSSSQKLLIKH
jgi:hypothetical protein